MGFKVPCKEIEPNSDFSVPPVLCLTYCDVFEITDSTRDVAVPPRLCRAKGANCLVAESRSRPRLRAQPVGR